MDPLSIGLTVGTSLLSGIANLISGNSQAEEDARRRTQVANQLRESLVSTDQLDKMLQNTSRLFNNRLLGTLNTTAISSRGINNAGVIKAAAIGQSVAGETMAEQQVQGQVLEHNTQVNNQIASVMSGGINKDPVGNFFGGAIGGLSAGIELSKMAFPKPLPVVGAIPGMDNNTSSTSTTSISDMFLRKPGLGQDQQLQNPWMGKTKITDEMINGMLPNAWRNF